jgi:hypothetical protein
MQVGARFLSGIADAFCRSILAQRHNFILHSAF